MRKSTIIGALATAGIALAGCSPPEAPSPMSPAPGTPPPPSAIAPAEGSQNGDETSNVNTDLQFAEEMLAYHEVELQLLEAAKANASRQWIVDLAQQFEREHESRIEEIRSWLSEHGQSGVPPQDVGPGEDAQVPNVGGAELLGKMEEAQQGRFAQLWVQGMLGHYQTVVDAATTEINEGSDAELRSIAEQIKSDREADIRELRQRQEDL